MSDLTLRYEYDASFHNPKLERDDFNYLSVSVANARFSGEGGFWVQWQDVREFAEALEKFPIMTDSPVVAQWGFNMQEADDLILRIEVAPADRRGNLLVRCEVADQHAPRERVRASFLTNYPNVEAFRLNILSHMDGDINRAVLAGQ
jgi:hypothetical protein